MSDELRALKRFINDHSQSEWVRIARRESIRAFFQASLPHLWDWIKNNWHRVLDLLPF